MTPVNESFLITQAKAKCTRFESYSFINAWLMLFLSALVRAKFSEPRLKKVFVASKEN